MTEQTFIPQRYQAAWGEISARLQSRQNVGIVYITGSTTLLGFALGGGGSSPSPTDFGWRLPFVLLLPFMSFAVAKWLRHNDAIIGLLGGYCAALEEVNCDPRVPAWHSKPHGFMNGALHYRVWSDHAAIVMTTIACAPAIIQLVANIGVQIGNSVPSLALFGVPTFIPRPLDLIRLLLSAISTVAGLLALRILATNSSLRASFFHEYKFESQNGRYAFWPPAKPTRANRGVWRLVLESFWISSAHPPLPDGAPNSTPAIKDDQERGGPF